MNGTKLKKLLILNLPYFLFGLYATKLGEAWRLAKGADASKKILHLLDGFVAAFRSPWPSFHPTDLLIGLILGCLLRLIVYEKSKNVKKYRHNIEYGSARWGTHADIAPFIDPDPWNNIILTKTESLTMSSRPKDPRNARKYAAAVPIADTDTEPVHPLDSVRRPLLHRRPDHSVQPA